MDFKLPQLGEGVYEAEFVSWLVQPGDAVHSGQNLLEVMTDKATMEVPSPFAGTIAALSAEPGDAIKVGQVVLRFTGAGEEAASEAPVEKKEKRSKRGRAGAGPRAQRAAVIIHDRQAHTSRLDEVDSVSRFSVELENNLSGCRDHLAPERSEAMEQV